MVDAAPQSRNVRSPMQHVVENVVQTNNYIAAHWRKLEM